MGKRILKYILAAAIGVGAALCVKDCYQSQKPITSIEYLVNENDNVTAVQGNKRRNLTEFLRRNDKNHIYVSPSYNAKGQEEALIFRMPKSGEDGYSIMIIPVKPKDDTDTGGTIYSCYQGASSFGTKFPAGKRIPSEGYIKYNGEKYAFIQLKDEQGNFQYYKYKIRGPVSDIEQIRESEYKENLR